jgi:protein-S-isoprenylcysteine O-methyltransferase Ste14
MKALGTVFLAPLVIGLGAVVFGLSQLGLHDFSINAGLVVLAVLLAGVIIAALLNFAVFGPVYWLWDRIRAKKTQTGTKNDKT